MLQRKYDIGWFLVAICGFRMGGQVVMRSKDRNGVNLILGIVSAAAKTNDEKQSNSTLASIFLSLHRYKEIL